MPLVSRLTGRSGDAFGLLQPQSCAPGQHLHGPFSVELSPSLPLRARRTFPIDLWLGLITNSPGPDGTDGVELRHPDYERCRVFLTVQGAFHYSIWRSTTWNLPECPPVKTLALFDEQGVVLAHGPLLGRSQSHRTPERFEFPVRNILVRRADLL